jgi:hypothetical protein
MANIIGCVAFAILGFALTEAIVRIAGHFCK